MVWHLWDSFDDITSDVCPSRNACRGLRKRGGSGPVGSVAWQKITFKVVRLVSWADDRCRSVPATARRRSILVREYLQRRQLSQLRNTRLSISSCAILRLQIFIKMCSISVPHEWHSDDDSAQRSGRGPTRNINSGAGGVTDELLDDTGAVIDSTVYRFTASVQIQFDGRRQARTRFA